MTKKIKVSEFTQEQLQRILQASTVWPEEKAIDRAIEELAELIVALQHYKRHKTNIIPVLNEMADVKIGIQHLEFRYDSVEFLLQEKVLKGERT
jgi:hypothetical protein